MRRHSTFLTALALTLLPWTAHAALTCTTVAKRGDTDTNGFIFNNAFRDEVAINDSGDVLFAARPRGIKDRLYLYPGAGGSSVVAQGSTAAPGGGTFASNPFSDISINDNGDLAFGGKLVSQGEGVFVRPNAGALAAAALVGGSAPGGGAFDSFEQVSRVNAAGNVMFLAEVVGGSSGVYGYSIPFSITSSVVANGDPVDNPAGRFLCDILSVDIGDGGEAAVIARTKTNCANAGEPFVTGVYSLAGTIDLIALVGDAVPSIGGATFNDIVGRPSVNAAGDVAFQAKTAGTISVMGLFTWDGSTIVDRVLVGDFEPVVGGSYKKLRAFSFDNTGNLEVLADFKGTSNNIAVVEVNGVSTSLVARNDAPPFGVLYKKFGARMGVSKDGADLGLKTVIQDTVKPRTKAAILRCS